LYWIFRDGVSRTVCLGCLQTMILLSSASWVTRITGVSHRCLARLFLNIYTERQPLCEGFMCNLSACGILAHYTFKLYICKLLSGYPDNPTNLIKLFI
jgi:hypothetical protein